MSYSYTCFQCYGKFDGTGVYHRMGPMCPQCAMVVQQREQFEEMKEQREAERKREERLQREENYRRQREIEEDRRREDERDRLRKEEADRRYWEDYNHRESYQPTNVNRSGNNFDLNNPEHFNKLMEIVERKLQENRRNTPIPNIPAESSVIPQNSNFEEFSKSTAKIDSVSTKTLEEQEKDQYLEEAKQIVKARKALVLDILTGIYCAIIFYFTYVVMNPTDFEMFFYSSLTFIVVAGSAFVATRQIKNRILN